MKYITDKNKLRFHRFYMALYGLHLLILISDFGSALNIGFLAPIKGFPNSELAEIFGTFAAIFCAGWFVLTALALWWREDHTERAWYCIMAKQWSYLVFYAYTFYCFEDLKYTVVLKGVFDLLIIFYYWRRKPLFFKKLYQRITDTTDCGTFHSVPAVFQVENGSSSIQSTSEVREHSTSPELEITEFLFCRKCGKKMSADSRFCRHCGTAVIFVDSGQQADIPPKI